MLTIQLFPARNDGFDAIGIFWPTLPHELLAIEGHSVDGLPLRQGLTEHMAGMATPTPGIAGCYFVRMLVRTRTGTARTIVLQKPLMPSGVALLVSTRSALSFAW